ncbi:site-specific DNA-methyltransferase [Clostridium tyrobutyricum]|uniref:site-specific DNA-methyltransferase n=1 Tax=Clostridium tyrobutyricum TaxID=1519 RepID=UPI002012B3E8|nr:site-specific DNA-methyltransferase [Clostridium tyrobutyricum]MBR9648631.1 site-specific DNA-methyltransferase [Clostridium tyrobutyricum]
MVVESKLMLEVKAILKSFGNKYFNGDKLKRHKVIEDLNAYDEKLIQSLLNNKTINRDFVISLNGKEVFKLNEFIDMFQYKKFWQDSYTNYANKIGLTVGGKFIDECEDVVLDFPYKDTVLKAGMTKEDKQKEDLDPNEIFLNEIIAKDEIDVLFDKKIFKNVKKYSTEGIQPVSEFRKDDNLIIKGNNLLGLYSIKERFAKKAKLIYIDVPYNTDTDSFPYNDSFNRSTWLTFIKNRTEIAKELLDEDGVIAYQISFHQYAYLKVMLDEIFKNANGKHVMTFNTLVRHPDRNLTGDKEFNDVIEYTLIYSSSSNYKMPKISVAKTVDDYIYDVELGNYDKILELNGKNVEVYLPSSYRVTKTIGHATGLKTISVRGSIKEKNSSGRFYVAHLEKLVGSYPEGTIFKVPHMGDDKVPYRLFELPKNGNKNGLYYQGMPTSTDVTYKQYSNFLNFMNKYNTVNNEGVFEFRNGKKPEEYIKFFIELFTKKDDLVLDFFMGSATTQAVAMKINRRFIGIEQMDYINTISVPRLQKVIEGEQGGISKDVNWQGGGSFVYAELFEKNTGFIKDILNAETIDDLKKVYSIMLEVGDLDFRADFS